MRLNQRIAKSKAIGTIILLLTSVALLGSFQRGTAESGTRSFSIFPLQLDALPTKNTLSQNHAV